MCQAIREMIEDGRIAVREEGLNILSTLLKKLLQDAREKDIMRAIEDSQYRQQLLQKYDLMVTPHTGT